MSNKITHRRSPSDRFRQAVNYIVRQYISAVMDEKDVAMLSAWIEGDRFHLLSICDDSRRNQDRLLRSIESSAKLAIKEQLKHNPPFARAFNAMVARRTEAQRKPYIACYHSKKDRAKAMCEKANLPYGYKVYNNGSVRLERVPSNGERYGDTILVKFEELESALN